MAVFLRRMKLAPKASAPQPARRCIRLRESEYKPAAWCSGAFITGLATNFSFGVVFTDKTDWLEEGGFRPDEPDTLERLDERRVSGPEETLSFLEDQLEAGEITHDELVMQYKNQ